MQPYDTHINHAPAHTLTHTHIFTHSQAARAQNVLSTSAVIKGKVVEVQYLFMTTRRAVKRGRTSAGLQPSDSAAAAHWPVIFTQRNILYMQSTNKPMQHFCFEYTNIWIIHL